MKSKQRHPAEAFPVIEFIRDEAKARRWSMWEVAHRMGGDASRNKLALEIIEADPTVFLGHKGAWQLAQAFGTSAKVWLNLERSWRRFKGLPLRIPPPARSDE